jgi:hypothetical protein
LRFSRIFLALCVVAGGCRTVTRAGSAAKDAALSAGFAAGPRVKRSGEAPCLTADFTPLVSAGALKSIAYACGDSPANGIYSCPSAQFCTRSGGTISLFDDRFELAYPGEGGIFARRAFQMAATIEFFKDDGRCNTPPVSKATYTGPAGDAAAMAAFCRSATDATAWGVRLPGGLCKDTEDGSVAAICDAVVNEAVRLVLQTL